DAGNYKVIVYSVDNIGNESPKATSDFIFDNSIPDIRILDSTTTPTGETPLQGAYIRGTFKIEVESTAPQQGKVVSYKIMQGETIKLNGAMSTSDGKKYSVDIDSNLLSNDSANIFLRVERNLRFQEVSRVLYIDNNAPEIKITSHTNNQAVQGAITLSGTANNNMGISKVEVCEKTADPLTYNWKLANGKFIWSYVISSEELNDDIETKYGVVSPNVVSKTFIARVTDRAGNTKSEEITFEINPALDYPKLTFDAPDNGIKASGVLTILARMEDDDYPLKTMAANISIYKVSDNSKVIEKNFSSSDQGFPNLTWVVDTAAAGFLDMTDYRIEVRGRDKTTTYPNTGSRWNSKDAVMVSRTFTVVKNAPSVEIATPAGQYEY
ncbi:MAG TPA: Ig-like domain-containing protein, partial [Spirochaetota bacterium]|nr:Ig-like domain-containing protein [Spirochaetota bacterium]